MSEYYDRLDGLRKDYFKVLAPEIPEWIFEYVDNDEMQRLSGISMLCGTDYSAIYNYKSFNSVLDHSVGVALMIWNFTHDKKQAIAGLFHDIAAPTFKHCIDFMNGDSEHQESTEERTESIIRNSKKIMDLLNRDGIKVEEVCDYHLYPIADNDTPRLSADRFEYTFSNVLFLYGDWDLERIAYFYNDIIVLKNEDEIDELGFKTLEIAKQFELEILPIFARYDSDENRTVMQFLADVVKSANIKGFISVDDLYVMSEEDVVNLLLNCDDIYIVQAFLNFKAAKSVVASDEKLDGIYNTSVKGKKRYIVPLVDTENGAKRVDELDEEARQAVEDYKVLKRSKWTGFDFEFVPYEFED